LLQIATFFEIIERVSLSGERWRSVAARVAIKDRQKHIKLEIQYL
jgi:hypothetical protein